jgi:hypothetical protein
MCGAWGVGDVDMSRSPPNNDVPRRYGMRKSKRDMVAGLWLSVCAWSSGGGGGGYGGGG